MCYDPVGVFRRVRAATKGRRPLETCSLERLANFLLLGYMRFAVTLSLAPSCVSGQANFRGQKYPKLKYKQRGNRGRADPTG